MLQKALKGGKSLKDCAKKRRLLLIVALPYTKVLQKALKDCKRRWRNMRSLRKCLADIKNKTHLKSIS